MSSPLVALMQPCAGYAVPYRKAAKAFWRPTARGISRVEFEQGTTSTPRTFNMLLADALNHFHGLGGRSKQPFTHLAMLHDDVAPLVESGPNIPWLDVMLDELEASGAGLLSAVVPIRSDHGLTSTAVDSGPDAPWVVRRLTMREVFDLPETFCAADVAWNKHGGQVLVNTGCWVARFDPEMWGAFCDHERFGGQSGFRFVNRVGRAPMTNEFVSQDSAEDWQMSRDLQALGLELLVTRKLPLEHGHPRYHTRSPWGEWATDMAYLEWQRRREGLAPPEGFVFPEEIEGWLTPLEGCALAELAAGKDVLEIGSYCGRSTVCLAQAARSVVCVDPFDGRATAMPGNTLSAFMENLSRYGALARVTVRIGPSPEALPCPPAAFDLCFVDGAHDYDSVKADAGACLRLLRPGGALAFHDYRVFPGEHDGRWDVHVTRFVDELIAGGATLASRHGSLAVVVPAA